jgi:ESCRT-I complex subunit MVB12
MPSPGYTLLDRTVDSSEKALKKRQIGIKMGARDVTIDAISDIIFQSKSKRAPEGYTLAGDINGFLLCFKLSKIPVETQTFVHAVNAVMAAHPTRMAPLPPISSSAFSAKPGVRPPAVQKAPIAAPRTDISKLDSKLANNPLADVTFCLNLKHQDLSSLKAKTVPDIQFRSINDIRNEYDYSFTLEKSAVTTRK